MSELRVKRLDSPLARSAPTREQPPAEEEPQAARNRRERPSKSRRQVAETRRLASVRPDAAPLETQDSLAQLPQPPPLGEALELLSTRVPISLRRSLSELTTALRTRSGERTSQKALPEQEVLAVLVWLAGSADDPAAVARLAAALDAYRARRYAAEAAALRDSS